MLNISIRGMIMNHWGGIYILPSVKLSITYNIPTIIAVWWIFRLDIIFYNRLPDWFMEKVWSVLNLDFWFKEDKGDK